MKIYSLKLAEVTFNLSVISDIHLPYFKEGTFRGAFGRVFRRLVCASPQQSKCSECMLFKKCAFSIVFSPSAGKGDEFFNSFEAVPRPFKIKILNNDVLVHAGEKLDVKVTLFGKAIEFFPYIFLSIQELGREGFGVKNKNGERGKFQITAVSENLPDKPNVQIYKADNPDKWLPLNGFILAEVISEKNITKCKIIFMTPIRLKKGGKIVQFVDFRTLIRSIMTRLNALSYFFGDGSVKLNFQEILDEAEKINACCCNTKFVEYNWHSGRQKTNIKLGGLVGQVEYQGNLSPFYPLLKAAEVIGVGKNTTFGFGQIKVQT